MRFTPASSAAPSTFLTPPRFASISASGDALSMLTTAAACSRASQPESARSTDARSAMSPTAEDKPRGASGNTRASFDSLRTSARTSCPASKRSRMLCEPARPVPPVTRIFMPQVLAWLVLSA